MTNEAIVDTLNDLIEICKDGEYGFSQNANYAVSTELKNVFRMRGAECRLAAEELKSLVRSQGGDPDKGGTISGALHRGWVSVRNAVSANDDLELLEECERGEDVAKARYAKALQGELPSGIRDVLTRQYNGVLGNHAEIKSLRDRYRVAA